MAPPDDPDHPRQVPAEDAQAVVPPPPPPAPDQATSRPRPRRVPPADAPEPVAGGLGRMRRPPARIVVPVLLGAIVGAFATATWQVRPGARTISGEVTAIDDTAVVIRVDADGEPDRAYGIIGALWREVDDDGPLGGWTRAAGRGGAPTCLAADDVGRSVRLGLVSDPGGGDRPVSEVVAWIECGPSEAGG